MMFSGGNIDSDKFGRLPKLIKLARLLRILKIIKEKSKIIKLISEILNIKNGYERIFFFSLLFITLIHINTCLWVFIARYDEEMEETWIKAAE